MTALLLLLAQDEALLRDLEGVDIPRAYRALEALSAAGPDVKAALKARAASASGRSRSHLELALRGPVAPVHRVTLAGPARSPIEWAQELARRSELPLNWDSIVDEKLPELAMEARDVPPLEALAALCKAADLAISWEQDQFVLFTGGYVDAPASRFGPFQLTLSRYKREKHVDFVKPASETVTLEALMAFEPRWPVLKVARARVLEARDDRGEDLRAKEDAPEADAADPELAARPGAWIGQSVVLNLKPLSRGAKGLALLRGELDVRLPRGLRKAEITKPVPGSTAEGRGFTVRVRSVILDESRLLLDVEVSDPALKGKPLIVSALKADGRRERTYPSLQDGASGDVARVALEIQPRGPVVRFEKEPLLVELLRVEIAEEVDERPLPFEFRGVSLR